MSDLIPVVIDGRRVEVERDTSVLDAAKRLGIEIPTLCYNENIEPYGVCRMCVVEIDEGKRKRIAPACVYPIRWEGLVIETRSERVIKHRRMLLQLLLARAPEASALWELASEYGITEIHPRLKKRDDDCILCGLCVRACAQLVGLHAIAFEGRGTERRVAPPFDEEFSDCIACGTCHYVCPTDAIPMIDEGKKRILPRWKREVHMATCKSCGRMFAPWEQLEIFAKRTGADKSSLKLCPDCRGT